MAESAESQSFADRHPVLHRIPSIAAGTIGFLALIVYPLGLIAYWIQIWRDYTHDTTVALYAASLVPVPVVAGRSLNLLLVTLLLAAFTSFAGTSTHLIRITRYRLGDRTPSSRRGRFVLSPVGRFIFAAVDLTLVAALIPQVWSSISFNSVGDLLFYVCAVATAGAGGHLVYLIIGRNLERSGGVGNTVGTEEREEVIGRELLSAWLRAGVTLALSAVIACLFLIPLQPPP